MEALGSAKEAVSAALTEAQFKAMLSTPAVLIEPQMFTAMDSTAPVPTAALEAISTVLKVVTQALLTVAMDLFIAPSVEVLMESLDKTKEAIKQVKRIMVTVHLNLRLSLFTTMEVKEAAKEATKEAATEIATIMVTTAISTAASEVSV